MTISWINDRLGGNRGRIRGKRCAAERNVDVEGERDGTVREKMRACRYLKRVERSSECQTRAI